MLSNACKYAIRAILYLALKSDVTTKIGAKAIAEELETPQPFLAKLLQQLTRDKLVSSSKGPNGGFFLNESNLNNTIWDVINSVDGTKKFDQCFLGLSKCNHTNPCPVHFIVAPFKDNILADFKEKTIGEYIKTIKGTRQVITLKNLNLP